MKLLAALAERADLKRKLDGVSPQISQSAVIRNGRKPVDDPEKLLSIACGLSDQLAVLIERINRTNATAKVADGRTIGQVMAARLTMERKHSFLTTAVSAARSASSGYDDKMGPAIDVAKYSKQLDDVAKKIRECNDALQQANFTTDLLD